MAGSRERLRREFEEVALPYCDDLYALAVRLARTRRDAEDLVQETLLRAYAAFDTFVRGSSARAWMARILTNLFINGWRHTRFADSVSRSDIEAAIYSPAARRAAHDPESLLGERLLCDELERALAALPDEYRLVVLLCDIEGFRYREIAEIAGCPIGTVMSRLSRARQALQLALGETAYPRPVADRLAA